MNCLNFIREPLGTNFSLKTLMYFPVFIVAVVVTGCSYPSGDNDMESHAICAADTLIELNEATGELEEVPVLDIDNDKGGLYVDWPDPAKFGYNGTEARTTGNVHGEYPAVIIVHGSHKDATTNTYDNHIKALAKKGIVGIAINYRDTNLLTGIEDLECAVRWVKAKLGDEHPEIDIDKNRIGLLGFSLGGLYVNTFASGFDYEYSTDPTNIDWATRLIPELDFTDRLQTYMQDTGLYDAGINSDVHAVIVLESSTDLISSISDQEEFMHYDPSDSSTYFIDAPINFYDDLYTWPFDPYIANDEPVHCNGNTVDYGDNFFGVLALKNILGVSIGTKFFSCNSGVLAYEDNLFHASKWAQVPRLLQNNERVQGADGIPFLFISGARDRDVPAYLNAVNMYHMIDPRLGRAEEEASTQTQLLLSSTNHESGDFRSILTKFFAASFTGTEQDGEIPYNPEPQASYCDNGTHTGLGGDVFDCAVYNAYDIAQLIGAADPRD